ncbi:MAG TPA: alpha/beta fold hydrolase [Thermoanaerobaculia bacterium]|nr:alpha/beta fold hydrolase [Thermoanaerobaculia bacterium]
MESSLDRSAAVRWRRYRRLALAGAALGAPAVAHALIQRRLRAPEAPGWGRTRRFAGHLGQVVFQELGAGEPIVLLHAFGPGFDAGQWRAAAEALAPHCRVLAPDIPGWGRSAPLAPRPETYLANLGDFLTGVIWSRAVLVGAGHAAPYAVHLAAEHPDLVRGVAVVAPLGLHAGGASRSTFPEPATPPDVPARARADEAHAMDDVDDPDDVDDLDDLDDPDDVDDLDELDELDEQRDELDELEAVSELDPPLPFHPLVADLLRVPILRISVLDFLTSRAVLAAFLRSYAFAAPERVDAAMLEHHYRVSHLPAHRQALAAYWRGELKLSAAATLRHLHVPVWAILGGEDDPNRLTADDLPPGSGIEVVAGTRALPHAERPLAVGEALARFLAGLPAS